MDYTMLGMLTLALLWPGICSKSPEEEEPVVPLPYSFSYAAGRAPGHTDRVHAETSDGSGVVRGMFSYIDPRQQVRTVEYVADQNGFHPLLITNPVQDTKAVAHAKLKHAALYNKIAEEQQQIAAARGQSGFDDGSYKEEQEYPISQGYVQVNHPRDTPVVARAKSNHLDQFQRIAEHHHRLALEKKAQEVQDGVILPVY